MNDTLSEYNNQQTNYLRHSVSQMGSPPVGPFISPPSYQDLMNNKMYCTMTCYNCLSVLLIRKDWNYTRCGECQKINKIPKERITENFEKYNYLEKDSDLIGDIPYVYGLVNCPFCTTENKIRKEAKRVTCYHCFNSFTVNGYNNDKIRKINNINRFPNNFIKYREYVPVYLSNDCNCRQNAQMTILNKILETMKDNKKPLIPYPTLFYDPFGFKYKDLLDNNYNKRYDSYRNNNNHLRKSMDDINKYNEEKKVNESNGFKITIRKKNKWKNKNSMDKSAVIEKVFYTNKLNDDNKWIKNFEN